MVLPGDSLQSAPLHRCDSSYLLACYAHRGTEDLGVRGKNMPFFLGGPARVWGLTGIILDGVIQHVIRPALKSGEQLGPG